MKRVALVLALLVGAFALADPAGTPRSRSAAGSSSSSTSTSFGFDGGPIAASSANIGTLDAGPSIVDGVTFNGGAVSTPGSIVANNTAVGVTPAFKCAIGGQYCTDITCAMSIIEAGVGMQGRTSTTPIWTSNSGTGDWTIPIGFINDTDTSAGGGYRLNSKKLFTAVAPTVVACSGTAASVTWANGNAGFRFAVGTSCAGESTAVITFSVATDGYPCHCEVDTADRRLKCLVTSTTVTTCQQVVESTGANGDFADNAIVECLCNGG